MTKDLITENEILKEQLYELQAELWKSQKDYLNLVKDYNKLKERTDQLVKHLKPLNKQL